MATGYRWNGPFLATQDSTVIVERTRRVTAMTAIEFTNIGLFSAALPRQIDTALFRAAFVIYARTAKGMNQGFLG